MSESDVLTCCGGLTVNGRPEHADWCPSHIRAALSWIDSSFDGNKVRTRAEAALQAMVERDGKAMAVTIPDVIPLARFLYHQPSVGCCLHMPLSAGEMDAAALRRSIQTAQSKNHAHCETLARVLTRMTEEQRIRVGQEARK